MRARLEYKKLMLYHNIINSDERRIIKKLLEIQQKEDRETTWHGNLMKIVKKYGIELHPTNSSKSQWKKHVKTKIAEEVEKENKKRCSEMKKGRLVKDDEHKKKEYLTKTSVQDMKSILKVRLQMNRIPANFKGGTGGMCPLCEGEEGNLEHYFSCTATRQIAEAWEVEKEDIHSRDLKKMKEVAKFMEKVEIMVNPGEERKKYDFQNN